MNKSKLLKRLILPLGTASLIAAPLIATSCGQTVQGEALQTQSYSDLMGKLANGTLSLGGAFADARNTPEEKDNIVIIGAADAIPNDGIQANKNLQQDDILAIQYLLVNAINASYNPKAQYYNDLQIPIGNGKTESLFRIYDHSSYTPISWKTNPAIKYGVADQDVRNAYPATPPAGSTYFNVTKDSDGNVTGVTMKETKNQFKILFIPSTNPTQANTATQRLQNYFKTIGFTNISITVALNYNNAASQLLNGNSEIAFLPAGTWGDAANGSDFIIQAGRPVQIVDPYKVATVDGKTVYNTSEPALNWKTNEGALVNALNGYRTFNNGNTVNPLYIGSGQAGQTWPIVTPVASDAKPFFSANGAYDQPLANAVKQITDADTAKTTPQPVGYYRSYIYANKNSAIYKAIVNAINTQGWNWKLDWNTYGKDVVYGYTSTTSSSSYIYPEQWFFEHFTNFPGFARLNG